MDQFRTNISEGTVDVAGRRQLAELIERLVAGELETDTFAAQAQELSIGSSDPAVNEIYQAADGLYSDLWRPYRLRGRRALPPAQFTHAERWVLFLHSSVPLTAKFPNQASHADWGDGCLLLVAVACVPASAPLLAFSPLWALPVLGIAAAAYWLASSPLRHRRHRKPAPEDPIMYWPFASQADWDAAALTRDAN